MRITQREKMLLVILGIGILIACFYGFVLDPQWKRIESLKAKSMEIEQKVQQMKIEIASDANTEKKFKVINSKTAVATQRFLPDIRHERIITIIDNFINGSNIKVSSVGFSDIQSGKIEPTKVIEKTTANSALAQLVTEYQGKPVVQAQEEKKDAANAMPDIEAMTVSLAFKGSYQDLVYLMTKFETYDKKIIVKSLNMAEGDSALTGSLALDFYAIPKIHDQDEEYIKWEFNNPYGSDNPFTPFAGYTTATAAASSETAVKAPAKDFIMTVKALSPDIPAVIMGKSPDSTAKSYIYGDNPGVENAQFEIFKEGNKYYYRYKVGKETYPSNYENDRVSFTPNGDIINFSIQSQLRKDDQDKNGINIAINNKTELQLNVNVDYEDSNRPRVKITDVTGNVSVNQ